MMRDSIRTVQLLGAATAIGVGLGTLVGGPATGAQTPIDLATGADVPFDGAAEQNVCGSARAGVSDVNNDGFHDMLIGAKWASPDERSNGGASYLVLGGTALADQDFAAPGPGVFRIHGAASGNQSGTSVAGAGDINHDGYSEMVIGAPLADNNTRTDSGSAYVVYGGATPAHVNLGSLSPSAGFRIDGAAAGSQAGFSVAGAGDVDHDGFDDVIVGVPYAHTPWSDAGTSYVVFGGSTGMLIDLSTLAPTAGFRIAEAWKNERSGTSVAGSSYVIYGSADPTHVNLPLPAQSGFRIDGAAAGDQSAQVVTRGTDVNGDGLDDLLISAPFADNNGFESGSAYV